MTTGAYTAQVSVNVGYPAGKKFLSQSYPVTILAAPVGGGGGGGGGDTIAPIISNVGSGGVTETTADISWQTNEISTSQMEWWSSPSTLSPLDETLVLQHLVKLTGLTPGTTYHYKTMSKDAAGNLAVSPEYTFTTLGKAPAAAFTSSNLSISPSEVDIGGSVTISVLVTNTGSASGSYEVVLKLNGVTEATKKVTVAAAKSESVSFSVSKDKAGTYSVDVDGLKGSFTVKEKPAPPPTAPPVTPEVPKPINWPLIGVIIGGVVVVGLLVFFLVRRRAA
jgi:hypothetical protein